MTTDDRTALRAALDRIEGKKLDFGLYRGERVDTIPRDYLFFCLRSVPMRPELRRSIGRVLARPLPAYRPPTKSTFPSGNQASPVKSSEVEPYFHQPGKKMPEVSLTLLVLKTPQVERLRQFYTSLGVELTQEQHGKGPIHFSGRIGATTLELYPLPEGDTADTTTRLGFTVEKLEHVIEALRGAGASIVREPEETEWGIRAVVKDPDGRNVELYGR